MRSAAATISGSAVTTISASALALARRPLEGLGRGVEVSRAVIDDGDALHCLRYAPEPMR